MANAVTVTIGATLSSGFLASFTRGQKVVDKFLQSTDKLDKKLIKIEGTVKKLTTGLGALNAAMAANTRTTQQANSAAAAHAATTARLRAANTALARSYRQAQQALAALQRQGRRGMPPTPRPPRPPGPGPGPNPNTRWGNIAHASHNIGSGLRTAGLGMAGVGGAGIGATIASIFSSSDFGRILAETVTTAGGNESDLGNLRAQIFANAGMKATGQTSMGLAVAVQQLTAAGRDLKTQGIPAMRTMGEVATATHTEMEDMAKFTNSLLDNFKLAPSQLRDAMNRANIAGKMGQFEFKNMAREFPGLSGLAAVNGLTGVSGMAELTAALQAARKGAGTGSEAATNVRNLLSSMSSRVTLDRFEQKGVNLEAFLKSKDQQGVGRLTAMADIVQEMTGGDAFRISELFRDMQAKDAILALIQHRKLFEDVKKAQGLGKGAGAPEDTITKGFDFNMKNNPQVAIDSMKDSLFRLGNTIAVALAPAVVKLANFLDRAITRVVQFSQEHPKLFGWIVKTGVAMSAFLLIGGTMLIFLGTMVSSVGSLIAGWGQFSALFPVAAARIGGVFRIITGFIPRIIPMFMGLGGAIAAVGWPVIAIGAAIVLVAGLVYKYWEPIKAFFAGVFEGIMESFQPIIDTMKPVFEVIGSVIGWVCTKVGELVTWFGNLFSQNEYTTDQLKEVGSVGKQVGKFIGDFLLLPIKAVIKVGEILGMTVGWIVTKFQEFWGWFSGTGFFKVMVAGFDKLGSAIQTVFQWVVDLIQAYKDAKNEFFGHDATADTAKGKDGRGFWDIRKSMIDFGAWSQDTGDDTLRMGKVIDMLDSGMLDLADLRAVRAVGFDKLGTGDNLDQPFKDRLDKLIDEKVRAQGSAASKVEIRNEVNQTIQVDKANATAEDIGKASRKAARQALDDSSSSVRSGFYDGTD